MKNLAYPLRWLILLALIHSAFADVRIKDIVTIENDRQLPLIGYGLVVGLNGTGDRAGGSRGTVFTIQSISNMLERFGVTVPKEELRTRNVAAVMITAQTPVFGRAGSKFDVTVSSLGDANSLQGGVLLMSPLRSEQGVYYGSAQGPISIGGYNIETSAGEKYQSNHALVGLVPNGGMLSVPSADHQIDLSQPLRFLLTEPDFVTACRIAARINDYYETTGFMEQKLTSVARPINAGLVELAFPDLVDSQQMASFFIATVETLQVRPDVEARVVINERTGTIVSGGNVKINEVLISHGNLTIQVKRMPLISQPSASFSNAGQTVVDYITETTVQEGEAQVAVLPATTSVSDLATALNQLALRPRDVIAIFQAIKQAGALNARLIIM